MKRAVIVLAGVLVVIACAMIATHRTNSGTDWTDKRTWYWTHPETGQQVKVLRARPIHTTTPDRFMLIGREERLSQRP
jgi:uncharacterized protein YxeA